MLNEVLGIALAVIVGMSRPTVSFDILQSQFLTEEEIQMIAQITYGEAGNQSELGKRLVIDVLLNRKDHKLFPNTVKGVIFQDRQFGTAKCINTYPVCDDICKMVKEEVFFRTNYDVMYFNSGSYVSGVPLFQEGDHYFSGQG